MQRMQQLTRMWLPVVLWAGLIFLVSHQPKQAIPAFDAFDLLVKKGGHVLAYAILTILLRRAGLSPRLAASAALAYAVSDEYHQTFIPGRTGRALDVVIDAVGIMLGVLVRQYRSRRTLSQ